MVPAPRHARDCLSALHAQQHPRSPSLCRCGPCLAQRGRIAGNPFEDGQQRTQRCPGISEPGEPGAGIARQPVIGQADHCCGPDPQVARRRTGQDAEAGRCRRHRLPQSRTVARTSPCRDQHRQGRNQPDRQCRTNRADRNDRNGGHAWQDPGRGNRCAAESRRAYRQVGPVAGQSRDRSRADQDQPGRTAPGSRSRLEPAYRPATENRRRNGSGDTQDPRRTGYRSIGISAGHARRSGRAGSRAGQRRSSRRCRRGAPESADRHAQSEYLRHCRKHAKSRQ